jgi:hypothetical protein
LARLDLGWGSSLWVSYLSLRVFILDSLKGRSLCLNS